MSRALTLMLTAALGGALSIAAPAAQANDHGQCKRPGQPIVIGHRGASGYRPEHTLAAYQLAIELGADSIEPDLVITSDGRLVARHENEISGTTNVADKPEFVGRRTTKVIDGVSVTGYFTEDFTLAELKTLRAKERLPVVRPLNTRFDGQFEIPTLEEVIALAQSESKRLCRTVSIYPETKHPSYFQYLGLPLEEPLVKALHAAGYKSKDAAVFIQSFEVANLKKLNRMTKVPLVQLLNGAALRPWDFTVAGDPRTYGDLAKPVGLKEVASYADGVGATKDLIVPRDPTGKLLAPTTLIDDAHKVGLIVHAWTFRAENQFLPLDFRLGTPGTPNYPNERGDLQKEVALFFGLGLDGMFSDNPDIAVAARSSRACR
jgi:glycerophosphoryl diester phosphodiesterase